MGPTNRDVSPSGDDWRRTLKLVRAGRGDEEIAAALRESARRKSNPDDYIARTITRARAVIEGDDGAPVRMRVVRAFPSSLPDQSQYGGPRRRDEVVLQLASADGEVATARVIAPTKGYEQCGRIWEGCFPGVGAEVMLDEAARDRFVKSLAGRHFDVALRDGAVRFIRAAE